MLLTQLKKMQILNVLKILLVTNKFFKVEFWQTMFCGRIEPLHLPLQHKPSPTKCNYAHVTYILHKTSNKTKKLCILFICYKLSCGGIEQP
jgi:hypothetical protein